MESNNKLPIGLLLSLHRILVKTYYTKEGERPLDFKLKLKLTRLLNTLEEEMAAVRPAMTDLYKKHGTEEADESGRTSLTIKDENKAAFDEDFAKFVIEPTSIDGTTLAILDDDEAITVFKEAELDRIAIALVDDILIKKA